MAEWQTHRTQNAAGNRVGSSPTAATQAPGDGPGSFSFAAQGFSRFHIWRRYPCFSGKKRKVEIFVEVPFSNTTDFTGDLPGFCGVVCGARNSTAVRESNQ